MKYGKEFQQILDDPSLPLEWKSSAIEYRRVSRSLQLKPGTLSLLYEG
jgi:hypothetical protein